jgi:hypothetical protein
VPNITGSVVELIYANTASGAAQNTFTSERTLFTTAEMGERPVIPPYYFAPNAGVAGGIRIYAAGILSTTSAPTFTWTIRLGSNGSTTAAIALGSAALTAATTVTNVGWELEGTIIMRTLLTAGASSTIQGRGTIWGFSSLASPFGASLYANAAQPGTVATFDPSITNYVNVNIACGTSSSSNAITLTTLLVFGLR